MNENKALYRYRMAEAQRYLRLATHELDEALIVTAEVELDEVMMRLDGTGESWRHSRGKKRLKSARSRVRALCRELTRYEWPPED